MRAPALVAVEQEPEAFAPLFAAASERGVRVGWLDLATPAESPATLSSAAASGAAKAVSATAGRVVVLKPTRGAAVLRDLLREHFLGCSIVLVRGHQGWPRLAADAEGGRLELASDRSRRLSTEELVAELARPRHRA